MTENEPDLDAIVRDCARNPENDAAFQRLDAAFRPLLLVLLGTLYSTDPSLAEDAYQSAFVKFIEAVRAGRRPKYAAYFIRIARNCMIDEIRRQQRQVPLSEVLEEDVALTLPNVLDQNEARILVLEATKRLDPRCQFIVESYYIADMSALQLARLLDVRPGSVHMAIKRCRDKLREILTAR